MMAAGIHSVIPSETYCWCHRWGRGYKTWSWLGVSSFCGPWSINSYNLCFSLSLLNHSMPPTPTQRPGSKAPQPRLSTDYSQIPFNGNTTSVWTSVCLFLRLIFSCLDLSSTNKTWWNVATVSPCVHVTCVVTITAVCVCVTCVVVLGAVSEVWFIFEDELWQREAFGHLDRSVLLPLKDQVVHGVTDCKMQTTGQFKNQPLIKH